MATIEDKLRLFTKIVFNEINDDFKTQEEKIKIELNQMILRENQEIEKYKEKTIKDMKKKIALKQRENLSKINIDAQRRLLSIKEEIITKLIEEIKEEIKQYVSTEEYKNYLLKEINSLTDEEVLESPILYLTEEDIRRFKNDIERELNSIYKSFNIKPSKTSIIGGFILEDKDKRFRIDNSLLSKICDIKDLIGTKVMDELN